MIPHESFEKIRQIGSRTNRIVTETLPGVSLQPSAQHRWVARAMPHSNHLDFGVGVIKHEVNRIRPTANARLACLMSGFGKTKRLDRNRCNHRIHFESESNTKSFNLTLIPSHRLPKFKCGFGVMDDSKAHFLYFANVSSRSCSHGMPRPGFLRASSARRSSSAICSGVSASLKSPNSNSISSTSSRRSASGIRRSSSRISALLIAVNYCRPTCSQARFSWKGSSANCTSHPEFP